MGSITNTRVLLVRRPVGQPTKTDFAIERTLTPSLTSGTVLVRNKYIGLAPGDLLKMKTSLRLGKMPNGYAVSEVIACHPTVQTLDIGDMIVAQTGWQEYAKIAEVKVMSLVNPCISPVDNLTFAGPPGLTAFHGLYKVARISKDQKILVNIASGVIGSLACQLAMRRGLRVTAVVSDRKGRAEWVSQHINPHEIILQSEISKWCRIDTTFFDHVFENLGSSSINNIIRHSLRNGFKGTKITLCGAVADYPSWNHECPPVDVVGLMETAITLQGFQLSQYKGDHNNARQELLALHSRQPLNVKTEIVNGLERLPSAYCDFYARKIFGKVIVQLH